jgi:hypothetical protein
MDIRRKLKHGGYSVIITVVFIAIAVLLNVVFSLLFGGLNLRFDLTERGLYSIEDSTREYLAALDDTVNIYFFNTEENFTARGIEFMQAHEIAKRFSEANRNISIHFADRLANPAFAAQFGGNLNDTDIVIESERTGRFKVVREFEYVLLDIFFGGERISMQQAQERSMMGWGHLIEYDVYAGTEQALLSAIMSVSDVSPVRVAFTRGFGEEGYEAMASLLEFNGYITEYIEMFTGGEIDNEIDFIVIFFPVYDFTQSARAALNNWLDNGGMYGKTLIYIPSPEMPATPNLNALTEEWGLRAEQGFIRQSDPEYVFDADGNTQLVRATGEAFAEGMAGRSLLTWFTRPVTLLPDIRGFETVSLIETYDGSFFNPLVFDEETDDATPVFEVLNVAAMSSKSRFDNENFGELTSRLLVVGSFYLFHTEPLMTPQLANADFLLNIFSDISGRDALTSQTRIMPKSFQATMFEITVGQANTIAVIFVIILPVLIVAAGLVVFFRRRYR